MTARTGPPKTAFLLTGIAVMSTQVAAQTPPGFEERVDVATLAAVAPALEAAARDSLPVEVLRAKVLEGVAKRRPPQLIGQVVRQLADDLRTTRSELRTAIPGVSISSGELEAAQLARQQGVPAASIAELWRSRPAGASLEIPVTVLTELVRRGIPADGAAALMRHILSENIPLDRAARIPDRFDGAHRPGVAPPAVLERALRDLNIPGPPPGRGPGGV